LFSSPLFLSIIWYTQAQMHCLRAYIIFIMLTTEKENQTTFARHLIHYDGTAKLHNVCQLHCLLLSYWKWLFSQELSTFTWCLHTCWPSRSLSLWPFKKYIL
jgi:hypothetical protein